MCSTNFQVSLLNAQVPLMSINWSSDTGSPLIGSVPFSAIYFSIRCLSNTQLEDGETQGCSGTSLLTANKRRPNSSNYIAAHYLLTDLSISVCSNQLWLLLADQATRLPKMSMLHYSWCKVPDAQRVHFSSSHLLDSIAQFLNNWDQNGKPSVGQLCLCQAKMFHYKDVSFKDVSLKLRKSWETGTFSFCIHFNNN